MKNLLKKAVKITIICSLLVFSSCEKDLYEEGIQNASRNITVTHVSLSNLDKTTSSKINKKISLLKNLKNETNDQGKFQYNHALGVYIDTENGKLVTNNGKLYYTFPMFRKSEENLENIIFTPLNSGEMETYFAKYNVKAEEFKNLTITEIQNLNPVFQKFDATTLQICTTINVVVTTYSGCTATHSNGETCGGESVTFAFTTCHEGGGDGSDGNGTNSSQPSSGGNHLGLGAGGGGLSTSPAGPSLEDLKIKEFIMQLSDDQNKCLNNLPEEAREALLDVLNPNPEYVSGCYTNNLSEDDKYNFIEDILDDLCTAGSTTTPEYSPESYPGMADGMPFAWWKDKDYIKANLRISSDSDINGAAPEPNALEIIAFIVYPSAAILHIRNSNLALEKANELVLDGVLTHVHNGKADAYRHAFWNARDTADFGLFITKVFTDAHEWNSCNNPKETQMDFFNNEQGRTIGQSYNILTSDSTISNVILTAVYSGTLLYLTPLAPGDGNNILTTSNLVPTNQ